MEASKKVIGGGPSSTTNALRDAFTEGRFSDITIDVRCKKFFLHRVVLWQIPFFRSLFEGSWKDSKQELLVVDIGDPLVTAEAFQDVIGTVYNYTIVLTLQNVLSIHAAASYLQLEELCNDCVDFISENLSTKNAVAYALFADSYEYMARKRLMEACKKFLLIHAHDMRDQLPQLPVGFLCELFKSDCLWTPSEFERFNLIMDVFECKLEYYRKNGKPKAPEGAADQLGDPMVRKKPSFARMRFQACGLSKRETVESVRHVLEDILCNSVYYEHLSLDDSRSVASRSCSLGMLSTMKALLDGRFKAEALQARVQGRSQVQPPPELKATPSCDEDLGCFRFGVELENAKGLPPEGYWDSDRVVFGGSEWWVVVRRRRPKGGMGHPYGVFLYRESVSAEHNLYSDTRKQLGVEAQFLCSGRRHQDKRRKFHKCHYCADWGFWEFMAENELDNYLTEKGSLRIGVCLRLVFGSC